jgi:hypothetical protein
MNKEVVSHSERERHCFQTVSRSPTFFQVTAVSSPLLTAHLVATDNNRIIKPSPCMCLATRLTIEANKWRSDKGLSATSPHNPKLH